MESAGSSSPSQSEQYSIHFPSQEAEKSPFLLTQRESSLYKISYPPSENTDIFSLHPVIWVKSSIFDYDLPSFASDKNYTQEKFDTQKIKIHELKAKNPKDPKIDLEIAEVGAGL